MDRRLIIDGQIFQTPAWHRGMGKYSFDLLRSATPLALKSGWKEVEIILSKRLKSDPDVLHQLKDKLPNATIAYLDLLPNEIGNEKITKHNRHIIDRYIQTKRPDNSQIDFLIMSIMQGEISPVFPTCDEVLKLVIVYDLIPLMLFKIYLGNPVTRTEYLSKIRELLKADGFLAISQSVANDLSSALGIEAERVTNIDGGPAEHAEKPKVMQVPENFILMPTGNDLRKNNERGIRGFAEFNARNGNKYKLLITSYFKEYQIKQLSQLSPDVVFTGNVSGAELSYLYERCNALLFPPEYEGLGMPIIEALEHGKPVACSDIPVFREMSKNALEFFDPYKIEEISTALERVTNSTFVPNKEEYKQILSKYSWSQTADKLIQRAKSHNVKNTHDLPSAYRVAIFAPNPSNQNEVSPIAQMAHAELSRLVECDYFLGAQVKAEKRISYLPYVAGGGPIGIGMGFDVNKYNQTVYYLDNSAESARILFVALSYPGILVLYDSNLSSAWDAMVEKGLVDESRLQLETKISKKLGEKKASYLVSLLASQKAIITFDIQVKRAVEAIAKVVNPELRMYHLTKPGAHVAYPGILNSKELSNLSSNFDFRDFASALVTVFSELSETDPKGDT